MNSQSCINIKVVAHYPDKKDPNLGSFHVLWEEISLELKGCEYRILKNGNYLAYIPNRPGKCKKTGKPIRYPLITWTDPELNALFRKALVASWTEYAKLNQLLWVKPVKVPQKDKAEPVQKPKSQFKQWQDPPSKEEGSKRPPWTKPGWKPKPS